MGNSVNTTISGCVELDHLRFGLVFGFWVIGYGSNRVGFEMSTSDRLKFQVVWVQVQVIGTDRIWFLVILGYEMLKYKSSRVSS